MNRIEISNLALNAIGARAIVSLSDDSSKEAKTMNLLYEPTLEEVLSMYNWPSVIKRARVAAVVEEENLSKWKYKYRLPNDCITVVSMLSGDGYYEIDRFKTMNSPTPSDPAIFEREGHYILSQFSPGVIKYVYAPEDSEDMRDILGKAVAMRLAHESALALGRDENISQRLDNAFTLALMRAKMAEASDVRSDPTEKRNWATYRGYSSPDRDNWVPSS